MPHRIETLREKLAELQEVMSTSESIDESTRQALQETIDEINTALEAEKEAEQLQELSPIESLQKAAKDFEESHPTLSGIIGGVIDALGQLGI